MAQTKFYETVYMNSMNEIEKAVKRLESIIKIKPDDPIEGFLYSKIKASIKDIHFALAEYGYRVAESGAEHLEFFLEELMKNIDIVEPKIAETNIAKSLYENLILLDRYLKSYSILDKEFARDYNHCVNIEAAFTYYEDIISNIALTDTHNIFDMNAYSGYLFDILRNKYPDDKSHFYGIDERYKSNKNIFSLANSKYYNLVKGGLEGARIQNNAFDLVAFNATVKADFKDNFRLNRMNKPERNVVADSMRYVRKDGIVAFTIPHFRMYKDVCLIIAKQLKNVSVYYTEDTPNLLIIGVRHNSGEVNTELYNYLRNMYDKTNATYYLEKDSKTYSLPTNPFNIKTFAGSYYDKDDFRRMIGNNNLYEELFNKIEKKDNSIDSVKPLLPFNAGQIGLVLTSGVLDGVVDEGMDNYHLVKGRVSKKEDRTTEIQGDNRAVTKVTSNRVEINILFPNGEYKTLA